MTKSGSLVSSANGEVDGQKAKYHEDHDIQWSYGSSSVHHRFRVCDPNCLFYKLGKEGSNRLCQMSKLTYSHEGLLWLFITWQHKWAHSPLPLQHLLLSAPFRMKGGEWKPRNSVNCVRWADRFKKS